MTFFTMSYVLYTLHSMYYQGAQDTSLPAPPSASLLQTQFAARREATQPLPSARGSLPLKAAGIADGRTAPQADPQTSGKAGPKTSARERMLGYTEMYSPGIGDARQKMDQYANNLKTGNIGALAKDSTTQMLETVSSTTGVPLHMLQDSNTFNANAIATVILIQLGVVVILDLIIGYILYLIWKQNCMFRRRAVFKAHKNQLTGDLEPAGLFGCFSFNVQHMVEAMLCPWCVISENLEKEKPYEDREPVIPFSTVCYHFCLGKLTCAVGDTCLFWCFCCPFQGFYGACITIAQRLRLSKLPDGVPSQTNCCSECVQVYACTAPCGNMQVAEFLEHHDKLFGGDPDEGDALTARSSRKGLSARDLKEGAQQW